MQRLQQLGPRLMSLSLGWRRLSDGGRLEKAVADLQQAHKLHTQQATEKQSKLENQLTLWQRHVFECIGYKVCVERSLCYTN